MSDERRFVSQVVTKAVRKLKAQRRTERPAWFGLGMLGIIGWSVSVPSVAGALLGAWLDRHHPGQRSWTLSLLVAGLVLGCANAWHWISAEEKTIHDSEGPP